MYSDYKSPFAYLAFDPAFALEQRYRIRIRWIPFQLRIKGKGERSLYSEHKARYSYLDARRWAKPRGLIIRGPLKVYDTTPALIGGLFAEQQGRLLDYSRKVYELFFKRELEADQPDAVASVITSLGMSAGDYRKFLSGDGALAYQRAQDEAANLLLYLSDGARCSERSRCDGGFRAQADDFGANHRRRRRWPLQRRRYRYRAQDPHQVEDRQTASVQGYLAHSFSITHLSGYSASRASSSTVCVLVSATSNGYTPATPMPF